MAEVGSKTGPYGQLRGQTSRARLTPARSVDVEGPTACRRPEVGGDLSGSSSRKGCLPAGAQRVRGPLSGASSGRGCPPAGAITRPTARRRHHSARRPRPRPAARRRPARRPPAGAEREVCADPPGPWRGRRRHHSARRPPAPSLGPPPAGAITGPPPAAPAGRRPAARRSPPAARRPAARGRRAAARRARRSPVALAGRPPPPAAAGPALPQSASVTVTDSIVTVSVGRAGPRPDRVDGRDHVQAVHDLAEQGVLGRQAHARRAADDEELAAVGVGPGVGHGERPEFVAARGFGSSSANR